MTLLLSMLIAAALTPVVVVGARRWSLLDVPNHRSSHAVAIPRGGGVAIVVAAIVGLLLVERSTPVIVLSAGAAMIGVVGLLDDRFELPALPRLVAQFSIPLVAAAALVDRSGVVFLVALGAATVGVASYVNAFNFMDGINGISGAQAAIAGLFLAAVGDHIDESALSAAGLAVCGASIGFLPYNAVRPRVFLGDVGSYFLGFWLSGLALLLVDAGASAVVIVGPFLLYLLDTSVVLARRARRGQPLMEAHREHAYQRLTQHGWSHLTVAALCAAVSAVCALIMYALIDASTVAQLIGAVVCVSIVVGYLTLPTMLDRRQVRSS